MEPISRPARSRLAVALMVLTVFVLLGYLVNHHLSRKLSIARLMGRHVPTTILDVTVTKAGQRQPEDKTRLAQALVLPLTGAMSASPTAAAAAIERDQIELKLQPIALSLAFKPGGDFAKWVRSSALLENSAFAGAFGDLKVLLNLDSKELAMEGIQGRFLQKLANDLVEAGGELHLIRALGKNGWVLRFSEYRSGSATRVLALMAGSLGNRKILLEKIGASVIEMNVGSTKFFLTTDREHFIVATSLKAMLNFLELNPNPTYQQVKTPLEMTVRLEGWLDQLIPAFTGADSWPISIEIDPTQKQFSKVDLGPARLWGALSAQLSPAVLHSLPADVTFAVAASLPLPADMTTQKWTDLIEGKSISEKPPAVGGMAIVWDLQSKTSGLSEVGLIVDRTGVKESEAALGLNDYASTKTYVATCNSPEGDVWLMASSELLLTRMNEACQGRSPNITQKLSDERLAKTQIFIAVWPGIAVQELFAAGATAADIDSESSRRYVSTAQPPHWRANYDLAFGNAKAAMLHLVDKTGLVYFYGQPRSLQGVNE